MHLKPAIVSLARYPIKGFGAQTLPNAVLTKAEGIPLDRAYAVEIGANRFDAQNPKWLSKSNFLQLMRHERLATLTLEFDEDTHTLTFFRDSRQVAKGALKTKLGRQMIEQFLSAYLKSELKGPPRIVSADGHSFTDIATKALHIVNLETIRDLSRVTGIGLDPLRFRANLFFDGLPAWEERKWLGKKIECGGAELLVFDETGRCEATSVDPKTAIRGLSIPSAIERTWGHNHLGVYARVASGGTIKTGDTVTITG